MLTLYECTASTSEYSFHANIADDIDDDQVSVSFQVGHSRFDDQIGFFFIFSPKIHCHLSWKCGLEFG